MRGRVIHRNKSRKTFYPGRVIQKSHLCQLEFFNATLYTKSYYPITRLILPFFINENNIKLRNRGRIVTFKLRQQIDIDDLYDREYFPLLINRYTIPKRDSNPPKQSEVHASTSKPPRLGFYMTYLWITFFG